MKVLLDTNIIIYREANTIIHSEIGVLFGWLDRLNYVKCIHPISLQEIEKNSNEKTVDTFKKKMASYHLLKTVAPELEVTQMMRKKFDHNENDKNDSTLLNELASNRVDFFITEDRKVHTKAAYLSIQNRVFTLDSFLEKLVSENPKFSEYKILPIKTEYFGNIPLKDNFFDSFRKDYPGFDEWFNKKSDETAYYCKNTENEVIAFLFLKVEDGKEDYSNILAPFFPKKRLKIGTFKVISNGYKLGERFIKIIFDNALRFKVDEIYVTIFDNDDNKLRLIRLLEEWGFKKHGKKNSLAGWENVLVRPLSLDFAREQDNPKLLYPYFKNQTNKWIVSIKPEYHSNLLPDSFLKNESLQNFIEMSPHRNAISKVFISRSFNKHLNCGDIIVFYRTKCNGPAKYTSVATTLGIVESVITDIPNVKKLIELSRKRSVYTDKELVDIWNLNLKNPPFIVNFLYLYSFPKRMNLEGLVENGIIKDYESAPRGFEVLSDDQFEKLLGGSNVDRSIIID
ncbi:PIN domain-containing protein [Acinetobacter soli]|uniref:PIN domain-containing protein n=1 Tax=Acinetobacter soli TaxID=487316 RepID=UPI001250B4B0|nr:PIN domain-containing protein [Acinetobacter soli]